MTINDAMTVYNLLNALKYEDEGYSLDRNLKVKLMRYKFNFEKINNEFVEYQNKMMEEVKTDEYKELLEKERTKEENDRFNEIIADLNSELSKLSSDKANEKIDMKSFEKLNEDEFNQILEVNINNSPTINGNKIDSKTFLELIYSVLVQ